MGQWHLGLFLGYQPTYEELKPLIAAPFVDQQLCYQPTYEELKPGQGEHTCYLRTQLPAYL